MQVPEGNVVNCVLCIALLLFGFGMECCRVWFRLSSWLLQWSWACDFLLLLVGVHFIPSVPELW